MRTAHRHSRLRAFVLGSALAHGLVLAGWGTALRFGGEAETVLSITLATDAREARPALAQPAVRTANSGTTQKPHELRNQDALAKRAARDDTTGRDMRHDPSPAAAASGADAVGVEARARIEAQLHTSLARHFDYPYVARLRGWEGSVLLAFIVQASGNLNDIRIIRSSGFSVLDDSAVDSLKKVQQLPEAVALLQGRDIEMQLPVIYRLTGER